MNSALWLANVLPIQFYLQAICMMASFYYYDQNPFRFLYMFEFGNRSEI